jgi:hypothetical protein
MHARHHVNGGLTMTIFGRRVTRKPVDVRNDACSAHVFMIHYVERDRVIICNAPTMQRAITFARDHLRVIERDDVPCSRPMMYDDDRICVMIYGRDHEYTCNVMKMDVHDHNIRAHITLAA